MIKILDPLDSSPGLVDLNGLLESIFEKDGHLQRVLDFEHRPEQEKMAHEVLASFQNDRHLAFEAGTGVGKSLAYLIPSILLAMDQRRPCVVATNTISLQEQILQKDVPSIQALFDQVPSLSAFREFSCALLVGRGNYLCATRLNKALAGQSELFDSKERKELKRIAEWADREAREGIRQELSPPPSGNVWESVNADSSLCSPKRCSPEHCFYRKARLQFEKADIIVLNHSLLFTLLGSGVTPAEDSDGILLPNDFLIFDEAHEMPEQASEHLGLAISSWSLENTLRRIYNPKKRKGLLKGVGRIVDFDALENALHAASDFFNHLHAGFLGERDLRRIMEPNQFPTDILPALSRVSRLLVELGETTVIESQKIEFLDQSKRLQAILVGLSEIIELKDADSVYWLERTGKSKQVIHLRSSPLKVANILQDELFGKSAPVLMTSATLTQNGDPSRFLKNVGCLDSRSVVVDSPFDYEFNMAVKIFEDCPEPTPQNRSKYLDYLAKAIDSLAGGIEGGTLALFTNYQDLHFCYHHLRNLWQKKQRSVYGQGIDYSRSELRRRMLEEGDALLLGAESFWKGFDAKGPALSQVIITRLPFENPNHPILEAKSQKLEAEGKNSFVEHTLPNALIRFRQGAGRLIRSKTDLGELIILDSRILRKSYGKLFLAELPKKGFEKDSLSFDF